VYAGCNLVFVGLYILERLITLGLTVDFGAEHATGKTIRKSM
jgi:hypothetical protein